MSMSRAMRPDSADVEAHVRKVGEHFPRAVTVRRVGESTQGGAIQAVTITDNPSADDDKQHVMIIAGQHGSEESGRIIALALMDWLASDEAAEVRRRQKIVIMPNVNPDGAEADTYETAAGVQLNGEHGIAPPASPEARAIQQVAFDLAPEAFVDLHARGFAGWSYDMVLYPWTRPYTDDHAIFHAVATDMAAAGERAGIPHVVHPLTWPGWEGSIAGVENPKAVTFAYRNFKSISILTETSESNETSRPAEERARVGVARVRALLEWGHRRHPSLQHAGYPVSLAVNMFQAGVAAAGRTAAERRASRIALWKNEARFKDIRAVIPERPDRHTMQCTYEGERLAIAAGLQFRVAGHAEPKSVRLNGRELAPSAEDGYAVWRDVCSTFVVATIPEVVAGEYRLEVDLH